MLRTFDYLDKRKWLFAFECEVHMSETKNVEMIYTANWFKKSNRNKEYIEWTYESRNETSQIGERNLCTRKLVNKAYIYMKIFKAIDNWKKYPVWADTRISWWNHCHMFYNIVKINKELKKTDSKWERWYKEGSHSKAAFIMGSLPFFWKISSKWLHHRYRWDLASHQFAKMMTAWRYWLWWFRENTNSIEFRWNELIHPFMVLYYTWAMDVLINDIEIDLVDLDFIRTLYRWNPYKFSYWIKDIETLTPSIAFDNKRWENDLLKVKNNFNSFINHIQTVYAKELKTKKWFRDSFQWWCEYFKALLEFTPKQNVDTNWQSMTWDRVLDNNEHTQTSECAVSPHSVTHDATCVH